MINENNGELNGLITFTMRTTSLLIVLLFSFGCDHNSGEFPGERQKLLLVAFDGLMPAQIERNETPSFDRLLANGISSEAMIPVFPSKTFPAMYSMVTGLYPENHGIISNNFKDEALGGWFRYGPPGGQNGEWWGGEPLWVTVERQSGTAATLFWPGSEYEIGGIRPTRWLEYDSSMPQMTRVDSVLSWLDPAGEVDADFATLYFSETDQAGHSYGPFSTEADRAVSRADELLGYLMERIQATGLSGRLNLVVVSDHGMAALSEERIVFLDDLIDLDRVEVIDWNPVAMLQTSPQEREELYGQLKMVEEGVAVYKREELPNRFRFQNHPRIPDLILVAEPGWTLTSRAFYMENGILSGNHGYDPLELEMHAVFLASGPLFPAGEVMPAFESVDLYEMVCAVLGISPAENDGSTDTFQGWIEAP